MRITKDFGVQSFLTGTILIIPFRSSASAGFSPTTGGYTISSMFRGGGGDRNKVDGKDIQQLALELCCHFVC